MAEKNERVKLARCMMKNMIRSVLLISGYVKALEYVTKVKFWALCGSRGGKEGWVPTANLEPAHS